MMEKFKAVMIHNIANDIDILHCPCAMINGDWMVWRSEIVK